jgi:two-component system sensor kinase FixL
MILAAIVQERQRVEDEARREREELAHVLRIATLGELTASIAHEINQPLTAIMTNTEAARRLLRKAPGETAPVQEALADIATAVRRATQVIGRLRALFSKKHEQRVAVDANALIDDIVGLLRNDMERRRIANDGYLSIVVRDTGIGVKESELERIFGHFVSNKPHGLGMGLAISRSIVEAHGGRIWATANADIGLTMPVETPSGR